MMLTDEQAVPVSLLLLFVSLARAGWAILRRDDSVLDTWVLSFALMAVLTLALSAILIVLVSAAAGHLQGDWLAGAQSMGRQAMATGIIALVLSIVLSGCRRGMAADPMTLTVGASAGLLAMMADSGLASSLA